MRSATMAGENPIPSKADSTPIEVKYEDLPEECRHEECRQEFEAELKRKKRGDEGKAAVMLWENSARCGREGEICHAVIPSTIAYFSYYQCKHFSSRPL